MITGPIIASLLVFVYYAVSFTKTPFYKLVRDPDWQNWAVRLWALALGVGGGIVDAHFGSHVGWGDPALYDAGKAGAAGAVGAIIAYHLGQPGWLDAFGDKGSVTTTTTTPASSVTTVTHAPPAAGIETFAAPLNMMFSGPPARTRGLADRLEPTIAPSTAGWDHPTGTYQPFADAPTMPAVSINTLPSPGIDPPAAATPVPPVAPVG